jgi:hypothetical protein
MNTFYLSVPRPENKKIESDARSEASTRTVALCAGQFRSPGADHCGRAHRSSISVAIGGRAAQEKSPVLARKINTIAGDNTSSQLSLDGLLISGLEVRVLPGSPSLQTKTREMFSLPCFQADSTYRWNEHQRARLCVVFFVS